MYSTGNIAELTFVMACNDRSYASKPLAVCAMFDDNLLYRPGLFKKRYMEDWLKGPAAVLLVTFEISFSSTRQKYQTRWYTFEHLVTYFTPVGAQGGGVGRP